MPSDKCERSLSTNWTCRASSLFRIEHAARQILFNDVERHTTPAEARAKKRVLGAEVGQSPRSPDNRGYRRGHQDGDVDDLPNGFSSGSGRLLADRPADVHRRRDVQSCVLSLVGTATSILTYRRLSTQRTPPATSPRSCSACR